MGYISSVRCLIYGEPDAMDALKMRLTLTGDDVLDSFKEYIRTYDMIVHMYADGKFVPLVRRTIDLEGDFKWYESHEDVRAWHKFMADAIEFHESIEYEFVRIGEEHSDVEQEYSADAYCLGVNSPTIYSDIQEMSAKTEGEN